MRITATTLTYICISEIIVAILAVFFPLTTPAILAIQILLVCLILLPISANTSLEWLITIIQFQYKKIFWNRVSKKHTTLVKTQPFTLTNLYGKTGIWWANNHLISALEIFPNPDTLQIYDNNTLISADNIPFDELARSLTMFGYQASSIDIITITTPLQTPYTNPDITCTQLAFNPRRTFIIYRANPEVNAKETMKISPDRFGAVIMHAHYTQLLQRYLSENECRTKILTDKELINLHNITDISFSKDKKTHLTPTYIHQAPAQYFTTYRIDPQITSEQISKILSYNTHYSFLKISIHPGTIPTMTAWIFFTAAAPIPARKSVGITPLIFHQDHAIQYMNIFTPLPSTTGTSITNIAFPANPAGIFIGEQTPGIPVFIRLKASPYEKRICDLRLPDTDISLFVIRCITAGIPFSIFTDRKKEWQKFFNTINYQGNFTDHSTQKLLLYDHKDDIDVPAKNIVYTSHAPQPDKPHIIIEKKISKLDTVTITTFYQSLDVIYTPTPHELDPIQGTR